VLCRGLPTCCLGDNDEFCPIGQGPPACDVLPVEGKEGEWKVEVNDDSVFDVDGSDYCTWAPDYDCYPTRGWATCCFDEITRCPEAMPECENTNSSGIENDYTENDEDREEDGDERDKAGNHERDYNDIGGENGAVTPSRTLASLSRGCNTVMLQACLHQMLH
jgi:hypothetical protein